MEDDSEDSLDLLLDTLCNAFGGIILITLLIALISQDANEGTSLPKSFKNQWMLEQQEILKIENELIIEESIGKSLQEELQSLSGNESLSYLSRKKDLEIKKQTLVEDLNRLKNELASVPANSNSMAVELENRLEELHALKNENAKLKAELEDMIKEVQSQVSATQSEIQSSKKGRTQALRLPKEKGKSGKNYIWVVVKYGRLYPLNFPDLEEIFIMKKVDEKATKFTPIDGKGIDPETGQDQTMDFFKGIDNGTEYLAFEVFADDSSFRCLNQAKKIAVSMGIGYTWSPRVNDIILGSEGRKPGSEL